MVKLSILALYWELFGTLRYRIAIWALVALVICWWLSFTILNMVLCFPISDIWNLGPTNQHNCVMSSVHYVVNGVSNVVTDVLILCLPIRVVWAMQLPFRSKLALSFIFLLGAM